MEFIDTTALNIFLLVITIFVLIIGKIILKLVRKMLFKMLSIGGLIATYFYFLFWTI